MIAAPYVTALSLLVQDAAGHSPTKPIPQDGAVAISAECNKTPASEMCAAVYVVQAFRESGYDLSAVGDGGKSVGPFQVWGGRRPKTWLEAVAQYAPILRRSLLGCPEPLEMLAAGRCGTKAGKDISRARMVEARRIRDVQITRDALASRPSM